MRRGDTHSKGAWGAVASSGARQETKNTQLPFSSLPKTKGRSQFWGNTGFGSLDFGGLNKLRKSSINNEGGRKLQLPAKESNSPGQWDLRRYPSHTSLRRDKRERCPFNTSVFGVRSLCRCMWRSAGIGNRDLFAIFGRRIIEVRVGRNSCVHLAAHYFLWAKGLSVSRNGRGLRRSAWGLSGMLPRRRKLSLKNCAAPQRTK